MSKEQSFNEEILNEDKPFELMSGWPSPEGFKPIVGEEFALLSDIPLELTRKKGLLELIKHYLRFAKKNSNKA